MTDTAEQFFTEVAAVLKQQRTLPHGDAATPEDGQVAGKACVALCNGDADKARTLWKLIVSDLGAGYMPHACTVALVRAANTVNLVPDVEAPIPS